MNKNPQIVATVVTVEYHNKNTGHDEIGSFDVRIDIQKLVSGIAYRAVQNKSNRTVARHGAIQIQLRHMIEQPMILNNLIDFGSIDNRAPTIEENESYYADKINRHLIEGDI